MAFPASTVAWPAGPAASVYQFAYGPVNGTTSVFGGLVNPLTSGQTAGYLLIDVPSGLDMPSVNTADAQRPLDQGEFAGLDTSQGRDITIDQVVWATTATGFDAQCRTLAGAVGWVGGNTEQPLLFQMPSGLYGMMARPRKSAFTPGRVDLNVVQAIGTTHSVMFHATDPRIYAIPTLSATVTAPVPGGGFTFPLTFPLTFAAGGTTSTVSVINNGNVEMRPVIVFTGPCINPVCTNQTATGNPQLGVTITLYAGDTLTLDTDFQSVVYRPGGTGSGSSVKNLLTSKSTWFNLPPGLGSYTTLQFNTSDAGPVAGTMTVKYASAYAGV
jgi:hypothetical protein